MKKIVAIMLAILLFILTFAGCERIKTTEIDTSNTYSYLESIMLDADSVYNNMFKSQYENLDLKDYRMLIKKKEEGYKVWVGKEVIEIPLLLISAKNTETFIPKDVERYEPNAYNQVKAKVVHFIETTEFFKEKDALIEGINNLPMYKANFTDDKDVPAYYDDDDKAIYLSRSYDNSFYEEYFERIVLHEMIHALQSLTCGGKENVLFVGTAFNEGMTELITLYLQPYAAEQIMSEYQTYQIHLLALISIFGEELVEAFFYGYEEITNKTSVEGMEFFSLALSNANYDMMASELLNTLLFNWAEEYKVD